VTAVTWAGDNLSEGRKAPPLCCEAPSWGWLGLELERYFVGELANLLLPNPGFLLA
jgi:hypothetical protein